MVRNYKRKTELKWNREDLEDAIKSIRKKNRTIQMIDIVGRYKISLPTLYRELKKYSNGIWNINGTVRANRILNHGEESSLEKAILLYRRNTGTSESPLTVRRICYEYCQSNGIINEYQMKHKLASTDWFYGFVNRHNSIKFYYPSRLRTFSEGRARSGTKIKASTSQGITSKKDPKGAENGVVKGNGTASSASIGRGKTVENHMMVTRALKGTRTASRASIDQQQNVSNRPKGVKSGTAAEHPNNSKNSAQSGGRIRNLGALNKITRSANVARKSKLNKVANAVVEEEKALHKSEIKNPVKRGLKVNDTECVELKKLFHDELEKNGIFIGMSELEGKIRQIWEAMEEDENVDMNVDKDAHEQTPAKNKMKSEAGSTSGTENSIKNRLRSCTFRKLAE